ncbi:unnamed protein product, partial [Sphacelaria rigidula]
TNHDFIRSTVTTFVTTENQKPLGIKIFLLGFEPLTPSLPASGCTSIEIYAGTLLQVCFFSTQSPVSPPPPFMILHRSCVKFSNLEYQKPWIFSRAISSSWIISPFVLHVD